MNEYIIDDSLESIVTKISDSQKVALRESIQTRGCLDPIIVWKNIVWDGIERFRICSQLGFNFSVKKVEFKNIAEAAQARILHHQNRRQMSVVNRIEAALNLFEGEFAAQAKANQVEGARNGGLAKGGGETANESKEKVWVNSLVAQLADTNPAYVSFMRNLRKEANNNTAAKASLFKLRRGDCSISSLNSQKNKFKHSSKGKGIEKNNAEQTKKTLAERFDEDQWGTNIALEQMKYENIKSRLANNQEEVINHDALLTAVAPHCKEDHSYALIVLMLPIFELAYRIGYIKGSQEKSEDGIKAEFINRESQIKMQLRKWLRDQDDFIAVTQNSSQSETDADKNTNIKEII